MRLDMLYSICLRQDTHTHLVRTASTQIFANHNSNFNDKKCRRKSRKGERERETEKARHFCPMGSENVKQICVIMFLLDE